jgi:peptidoglycan hydrolase-like protein with peptidoglycan-binding domain
MRNMLRALAVTPLLVLSVFTVAHAQSNADLQAQLNALLQQLSALQAQLQTSSPSPSTIPAATGAYGQCPNLFRALRQGMSGSDVTALQAYLAADASLYPERTVSGYFGALTTAAIQRFQARNNIVTSGSPDTTGYGAVGPSTRNAIARLCSGTASSGTSAQLNCSQGGIQMASGTVHDFYTVSQAPTGTSCAGYLQTRQCINGSLSGNPGYQYASCSDAAQQCTVNGNTVANGASFTYYARAQVSSNESCGSYAQTRTCTNGVMSGSTNYQYLTCTLRTPDSCSVGGTTIQSGQSRIFYKQDAATSTASCSAYGQTRTCNDGVLSGDGAYTKTSCTAGACSVNGLTLPNGSSTALYLAQNIPTSEQCSSYVQTRSCSNGTLSGNAAYQYSSCAPVSSGSCALDSVVLSSGQAATFYSTSTAAVGTTCGAVSQTRTCASGTLSGTASYNRASCSATRPCSLDGVSVPHGESFTFYSDETVAFGTTCSSKAQVRACTNGTLSGTATYKYDSCSVNPPTAFGSNTAQLAAALTALQSILQAALDKLDSWF